ncbi:MAG: PEP-CTERM sorting domain-containing protein, partial [Rhodospirillaceae bacterium]|nr:PEP-CTERM sorting domain-containing protein [Rhodospirillaceae bacterium]
VAGTSGTLIVNGGEFTASNTSTDSNSRADLLLGLNGSTGRLEVRDGGTVTTTADAGQGRIGLLGATSAAATILVDGAGSLVEASDYIGIGAGGASPRYGTVLLANGGCIKAPTVEIFAGSLLGGIGCVQGNVINNGGFVVPGSSPGTLDIFGDYTQTGGTIDIEVNGFAPGQYDVLNVSGNTSFSNVVFRFIFGEGAQYLSGSSFDFINVAGSLSFSDIQYEYLGTPQGLETAITFSPDGFGVVFSGDVAGVPVPGAAALFGLGLFGLGALRRRRTVPEKVAA